MIQIIPKTVVCPTCGTNLQYEQEDIEKRTSYDCSENNHGYIDYSITCPVCGFRIHVDNTYF